MTEEKWNEIRDIIRDKFQLLDERIEDLPEYEGQGVVNIIEFIGPIGKVRLERTDQALLLDKKTLGSRRIGSETKVQYIYSDTERIQKFRAFRWDEMRNSWEQMEMDRPNFFG